MSSPSTVMSAGGEEFRTPLTLICNSTGSPTPVSELLRTAVTDGSSPLVNGGESMVIPAANTKTATNRLGWKKLNLRDITTNPYRHVVKPCVHQAGHGAPRPSPIAKEVPPAVRSSL